MTVSNVIKLLEQPGGDLVWSLGERNVARVFLTDPGLWAVSWRLRPLGERRLADLFPSPHAACLAAEKLWDGRGQPGWIESVEGGFFRKLGRSRTYVRQAVQGWYAVRDHKVLGKAGDVVWFTTATDAMAAVERDHYTPLDPDPFRDPPDRYTWVTIAGRRTT